MREITAALILLILVIQGETQTLNTTTTATTTTTAIPTTATTTTAIPTTATTTTTAIPTTATTTTTSIPKTTTTTTTTVTPTTATPLTFDQQVSARIAGIEATRTEITTSYSSELPALRSTLSSIYSLLGTLPTTVVTQRLATTFTTLETIAANLRGTIGFLCFNNYTATRTYAAQQARIQFTNCSTGLISTTNQAISSTVTKMNAFNAAANQARVRVYNCGANSVYRISDAVFSNCLTTATSDYNNKTETIKSALTDVQNNRTGNVNSIAACAATSIAAAEVVAQNYNRYIANCITNTSTTVAALVSLITAVTITSPTAYTAQLSTTTTSANLTKAQQQATSSINAATTAVATATTAKTATFSSIRESLEADYTNATIEFAKAAATFQRYSQARRCVYSIRDAAQNNIYNGAVQIAICLRRLPTTALAITLAQISNTYTYLQTTARSIDIQCLSQVSNLYISRGVANCIQTAMASATTSYNTLFTRAGILTASANLISTQANTCNTSGRSSLNTLLNTAKTTFESCIFRTLGQNYTIHLQQF